MIGIGIGVTFGRAGPVVDTDAAAWAAAVTGAGGTYSASTLAAVSAFCVSAKASNYWTKLNRINLFCGNQLAAALVPLKVGGGNSTETNVNFVAGDYTEATGLTGNASTKYLTTGLVPSVSLTLNSTHIAVYNRSSAADFTVGSSDATNFCAVLAPSGGSFQSLLYDNTFSSGKLTSGVSTPYGFLCASRIASNDSAVYRNGTSLSSIATTGGALPAFEMYVAARNLSGSPINLGAAPCGGYSIGSGLSAADVTAYNTHMQAFQTALSRQV